MTENETVPTENHFSDHHTQSLSADEVQAQGDSENSLTEHVPLANETDEAYYNYENPNPEEEEETPTSSPRNATEESLQWYYLDSNGKEQGPFNVDQIKTWWLCGYFSAELPLRCGNETDFGPISQREEIVSKQTDKQKQQQIDEQQLQQQLEQIQQLQQQLEQQIEQQTFYPPTPFNMPTYPGYSGQKRTAGGASLPQLPGMYFPQLPPFPYPRGLSSVVPSVPSYEHSDYPSIDDEFQDYKFTAQFNTRTGKFQSSGSVSYWQSKRLPDDPEGRQLAHYFDFEAYQDAMRNSKRGKPKKPKKPKKKKPKV